MDINDIVTVHGYKPPFDGAPAMVRWVGYIVLKNFDFVKPLVIPHDYYDTQLQNDDDALKAAQYYADVQFNEARCELARWLQTRGMGDLAHTVRWAKLHPPTLPELIDDQLPTHGDWVRNNDGRWRHIEDMGVTP